MSAERASPEALHRKSQVACGGFGPFFFHFFFRPFMNDCTTDARQRRLCLRQPDMSRSGNSPFFLAFFDHGPPPCPESLLLSTSARNRFVFDLRPPFPCPLR